MATSDITPFACFTENFAEGMHDFSSDVIRVMLTNTAPDASDTHVDTSGGVCILMPESEAQEIAAGTGYPKGGLQLSVSSAGMDGDVYRVIAGTMSIPALGNQLGPLRYAVIYNASKGSEEARPVIGWMDYGEALTLEIGETLKIEFDQDEGIFTLAKET